MHFIGYDDPALRRSCYSPWNRAQWWIIVRKVTFIIPFAFFISLAGPVAAYLCRKLNSRYPLRLPNNTATSRGPAFRVHLPSDVSVVQIDCMDLILRIRHQRTAEQSLKHHWGHASFGGRWAVGGSSWACLANKWNFAIAYISHQWIGNKMYDSLDFYFMSINCILCNFPFPFWLKNEETRPPRPCYSNISVFCVSHFYSLFLLYLCWHFCFYLWDRLFLSACSLQPGNLLRE